MGKLKTEINSGHMEDRITEAFASWGGQSDSERGFSTAFEHGQWWIIMYDGRIYSVVDATGGDSVDGFSFEET